MDFRQYDNALGRFHNMDRLTELAPSITPYRFGFNNPNYWSDPTGLFETRELALAHISNNNLTGADVFENVDGTFSIFHQVGNGSYTITMIADELVISGTIKAISIGGNNGGGSNGGYLGGGGYPSFSGSSGKGGYDSSGSGGGNSNSSGKNKGYFANYFKSYFSYKRSAHSNAYSPYIPTNRDISKGLMTVGNGIAYVGYAAILSGAGAKPGIALVAVGNGMSSAGLAFDAILDYQEGNKSLALFKVSALGLTPIIGSQTKKGARWFNSLNPPATRPGNTTMDYFIDAQMNFYQGKMIENQENGNN